LVEFTGERVVPGQVNVDLWSEHVARYAFARRYAEGKRVLDAGCGTGYGSAELALSARSVTGIDLSTDAVEYASRNYTIPALSFLSGSCTALPFANASFDLAVAFEVIEHLEDYRALIAGCARVLAPQGLFIVSSPNKSYYAESRSQTGPNPFHHHEFEPEEFFEELRRAFPHVLLLYQNRVESFAFHPIKTFWPADARVDGGGGNANDAHFLIAVCALDRPVEPRSFVYVPKAANILREREQHLALLEKQLAEARNERDSLLEMYRLQKQELEDHNRWAEQLSVELKASSERVLQLQHEVETISEGYEARVQELEQENQEKTQWALETDARLTKELEEKCRELFECVKLLETSDKTVEERTLWAQRLEAERANLAAQLNLIRASRWLKLGRRVGLGPVIQQP
jgi:SAM-dependent methyltransferase